MKVLAITWIMLIDNNYWLYWHCVIVLLEMCIEGSWFTGALSFLWPKLTCSETVDLSPLMFTLSYLFQITLHPNQSLLIFDNNYHHKNVYWPGQPPWSETELPQIHILSYSLTWDTALALSSSLGLAIIIYTQPVTQKLLQIKTLTITQFQ